MFKLELKRDFNDYYLQKVGWKMKSILHKANTRGHADHGWLKTYHTFSFANYYDPARVHFGALRVLNDDIVQGGTGFGMHSHDNMEIVTIMLQGAVEHRDNSGGHGIIKFGEVQIMSAGSGISHSEFNASKTERLNLLQIWVFPNVRNIKPSYGQKTFNPADRVNKLQLIVSPAQNNGTLFMNQNAWFSIGTLKKNFTGEYKIMQAGNGVYAFVIEGDVTINNQGLNRRDGLGIWETDMLMISAVTNSEVLLMDVPME